MRESTSRAFQLVLSHAMSKPNNGSPSYRRVLFSLFLSLALAFPSVCSFHPCLDTLRRTHLDACRLLVLFFFFFLFRFPFYGMFALFGRFTALYVRAYVSVKSRSEIVHSGAKYSLRFQPTNDYNFIYIFRHKLCQFSLFHLPLTVRGHCICATRCSRESRCASLTPSRKIPRLFCVAVRIVQLSATDKRCNLINVKCNVYSLWSAAAARSLHRPNRWLVNFLTLFMPLIQAAVVQQSN